MKKYRKIGSSENIKSCNDLADKTRGPHNLIQSNVDIKGILTEKCAKFTLLL